MNINSVLILILSVFIASYSQILLKISANKDYISPYKEYLNRYVVIAYCMLVLTTVLTIIAYRGLDLKYGSVIESFGYVFILVLGRAILHEKITVKRLLGISIIIIGIAVFTL